MQRISTNKSLSPWEPRTLTKGKVSMPHIGNVTSFPFLLVPGNRGKEMVTTVTKTRNKGYVGPGLGMRVSGCTTVGQVLRLLSGKEKLLWSI